MVGVANLFPEASADETAIAINDRCQVRTQDGYRVVIVSGIVMAQFAIDDQMAESHAMVNLMEQGWADQNDMARVFGCSPRTVRRYQRRYAAGGLAALGSAGGFPRGRTRLAHSREKLILRMKTQGLPNREIARRLGVTPKAIRKLLRRLGWRNPVPEQIELPIVLPAGDPNMSAFSSAGAVPSREAALVPGDPDLSAFDASSDEVLAVSFDTNPSDRRADRLLAYLGLLDDAASLFQSEARVPHAGVLLALPSLVASGIFTAARKIYGSIGPAFYGLRTT